MFDFSKINSAQTVTKEWLFSKIDDKHIFRHYYGPFQIGKAYPSKLRKDHNPSTSFFISKKGTLLLKDFRENKTWDAIAFVQTLYGLNFKDALLKIANDFGLINKTDLQVSPLVFEDVKVIDLEVKSKKLIQFIPDEWTKRHIHYWKTYEIGLEELMEEGDIYPVKELYIDKKHYKNYNNELRFAYVEKDGVKIYSPFSKRMKWISSLPLISIFGLDRLPYKSDTLFVTKSWKDRKVLKKLFTDVIATQNESESSFPKDVQEYLKTKYKNIIIVYGADPQGVETAPKFGFPTFTTPIIDYKLHGIEDPADYIQWYGLNALKELFKDYEN